MFCSILYEALWKGVHRSVKADFCLTALRPWPEMTPGQRVTLRTARLTASYSATRKSWTSLTMSGARTRSRQIWTSALSTSASTSAKTRVKKVFRKSFFYPWVFEQGRAWVKNNSSVPYSLEKVIVQNPHFCMVPGKDCLSVTLVNERGGRQRCFSHEGSATVDNNEPTAATGVTYFEKICIRDRSCRSSH